ncbi:MAG: long-chain fatty acid--CoA ligase [Planctomycetota bacterium]|nr:MAG: long-chain fatty acid--CoA ligase [Planctomycetota bacterium]
MQPRPWHRQYDAGVPATLEYDGLPLPDVLAATIARHGDRVALCFMGRRQTWRQLGERVDRLATAMTRMGVTKGSAVAVHLPNLPQTVLSILATLRCGAHVVMTNPLYTAREIEHQWNDSGVTLAVTADFLWARTLAQLAPRIDSLQHTLVTSIPEALPWPMSWLAQAKLRRQDPPLSAGFEPGERVHAFAALVRRTPADPPSVRLSLEDPAAIQYTGGTTGVSKGAVLSHGNLAANSQQVAAWLTPLGGGPQVVLGALPFFHVFGLSICVLLSARLGSTLVVVPNPRDVGVIIDLIEKHRISVLPAVPAMLDAISTRAGIESRDLTSVRGVFSGSAPLTMDSKRRFEALTGAAVFEGYGLTETSPVTHVNPVAGENRIGSVGLPLPDTDARIVDPDDATRELPVGEAGELLLRGPQVMAGYWKRPDETALVLKDGWFATGDLAVMDDAGWFSIAGRKKDMIICSGYNVYPDEVDSVLCDHPDVAEACTIGLPDERRGETVKSFVVARPGASVDESTLRAHCRENLAAYKVPRSIEFRAELPRSALMKLLRRELRAEEIARRESDLPA